MNSACNESSFWRDWEYQFLHQLNFIPKMKNQVIVPNYILPTTLVKSFSWKQQYLNKEGISWDW